MSHMTNLPFKEARHTGPWVSMQLPGQLQDVLHDDGLVGHTLHQSMPLTK